MCVMPPLEQPLFEAEADWLRLICSKFNCAYIGRDRMIGNELEGSLLSRPISSGRGAGGKQKKS